MCVFYLLLVSNQELSSSGTCDIIIGIVTHHCPTLRKEFNNYPGGALNSAFQVDLDAFIEGSSVDYWIYGHTHYAGGSGSKIGKTTLLCNQLGYVFQNEHLNFDGKAVVEIK